MNSVFLKTPEEVVVELNARGFYPDCSALKTDSRELHRQDIFIAMPGKQFDPRPLIPELIKTGDCSLVLVEYDDTVNYQLTQVIPVKGLNTMVPEIANLYYQKPSKQLTVVAVTGTNGKTSVTRWLAQALNSLGIKAGVVGTLGFGLPDGLKPNGALTTPDAVGLHRALYEMKQSGFRWVCLEASSIGLEQGRLGGVNITAAVYCNLTQDHLDYHETMAAYKRAKLRLAKSSGLKYALINADDAAAVEFGDIAKAQGAQLFKVSQSKDVDFKCSNITVNQQGVSFKINGQQVTSALQGTFNIYNLALVYSILHIFNVASSEEIAVALAQVTPPPGRMQLVNRRPTVIVDYAHTPDALRQVLAALKPSLSEGDAKLRVVFGCGGDRDRQKRPLMAAAGAELADVVYLTSDNPRSENPEVIIQEMLVGITDTLRHKVRVELNRDTAIRLCLSQSNVNDVVLLAGKGHESHQIVNNALLPHSDALSVAQYFKEGCA